MFSNVDVSAQSLGLGVNSRKMSDRAHQLSKANDALLSGSANVKGSQLGASSAMAFEVLVVGDSQVPALITEILPASDVGHRFELIA
jgi:hypothetical protein